MDMENVVKGNNLDWLPMAFTIQLLTQSTQTFTIYIYSTHTLQPTLNVTYTSNIYSTTSIYYCQKQK